MPRRNRVDPFGDLHAVSGRGLLTGNRGCLVDDNERVVRHHASALWIACVTEFRGWRSPLAAPHHWTPIFFLDDAVALAAGHRPCALCRRDAYQSYRDGVTRSAGSPRPLLASELNVRLAAERLRRGRGLDRAGDRITWRAPSADLPAGTIVLDPERRPRLLLDDRTLRFTFDGWTDPRRRPSGEVEVLTPQTSVRALASGYTPLLHPTARTVTAPGPISGPRAHRSRGETAHRPVGLTG
jgi:hypothetical protein